MPDVNSTLAERGSAYGPYDVGVQLREDIMLCILEVHKKNTGNQMEDLHKGFIYDIVNKLSRLATTPSHIDTWHDIQGYAKLTENFFIKESQNADR